MLGGMTWPPAQLSWSTVLAGWGVPFLSVDDVRTLAEARLLSADGEALIPLSDLAGLRGDEHRRDVEDALTRLARPEGLPPFFARREWQVFRLAWQLDHPEDEVDPEEPAMDAYLQMRALEETWQELGAPLDVPPLNPFIRSYLEVVDTAGGLALTLQDLRAWLAQQRELLAVVAVLLAAGRAREVAVLAAAFETAQASHEAHLTLVRAELAMYQRVHPQEQDGALWREIETHNAAALKARQKRAGR